MLAQRLLPSENNTKCDTTAGPRQGCSLSSAVNGLVTKGRTAAYPSLSEGGFSGARALCGKFDAVLVVLGVDTKTHVGEREPESALVLAVVAVLVSLDPSHACIWERGVARLEREGIDKQVHEDSMAVVTIRVGKRVLSTAELADKTGVHVVQRKGPDLTHKVLLFATLEVGVCERVHLAVRAVHVRADAFFGTSDVRANGEVADVRARRLPDPVGKRVADTLAESASLGRLQALCGATTGEAVGQAVSILVQDPVTV